MTRAWPLQEGVPGEETDHAHDRSFWVAHGLVNGVDFWSEAACGARVGDRYLDWTEPPVITANG